MPEFHVSWEIEVGATTSHEAALEAQRLQRDPEAIVGVFIVTEPRAPFRRYLIDLNFTEPQGDPDD